MSGNGTYMSLTAIAVEYGIKSTTRLEEFFKLHHIEPVITPMGSKRYLQYPEDVAKRLKPEYLAWYPTRPNAHRSKEEKVALAAEQLEKERAWAAQQEPLTPQLPLGAPLNSRSTLDLLEDAITLAAGIGAYANALRPVVAELQAREKLADDKAGA